MNPKTLALAGIVSVMLLTSPALGMGEIKVRGLRI